MKFFCTIFIFCFLYFSPVSAQDYVSQLEITQKVIAHFEVNETVKIYELFDDTMKGAITVEKLEEIWKSLPAQCGGYLGSGEAMASEVQGMVVVNQLLDFENVDLDIRLAFNDQNQISGLFFVSPVKKKE